ncbi:MAG TPA: glycosyltransferase [Alphaproteobacteria bacterium]|nr:glycosyltransferase [Alphaproteobacteria bacterium]
MKVVIFGLTVSSSWGNGHATLWRGLIAALAQRGHEVVFFERDVPYYAEHRDLAVLPAGRLHLYPSWPDAEAAARLELQDADVGVVTSYCPDGITATTLLADSKARYRVFYDLDTPVTLARLAAGESVSYIGPRLLADFDLVLSYTGGRALDELRNALRVRRALPLYGSVDPTLHRPEPPSEAYRNDFSYLGTYAADRQSTLVSFFIEPARRLPERKFLIGGAQYPQDFPWTTNIFFARHVAPPEHPAFYSSSRLTLNVTRQSMARFGWCPSGRLFEAAACGVPIVSDAWEGLDAFFTPGREILVARDADEVVGAIELSDAELAQIARAARERTLAEHTAEQRARDFEAAIESIARSGDSDLRVA